jgi:phage-related protein
MTGLTAEQSAIVNRLAQSAEFFWMLEVEVPSDPPSRYRLNNTAHSVDFGVDSQGDAQTYLPHPFVVSGIAEDSHGGIHSATVSASNVRRELMAAIEHFDGLIGSEARTMLAHKALLSNGEPFIEIVGIISTHRATAQSVEFVIGREDQYKTPLPLLRTNHDYCTHQPYGGLLCGYDTTTSGALQTCSFLLEGANGCRAHGDAEEAAGLENRHPRRWGGQFGVPRRQGVRL